MAIKRYLYLWHRWLGIALCLFMALWFVSGVVMLYVGYPKLTPAEHLAHLPELAQRDCCVSLQQVLAASGRSEAPAALRLSSVAGAPRYLLDYADGARLAVDARSGRRIAGIDAAQALASARQFAGTAPLHYRGLIQEDAWSRSRALDPDRPLHRVQLEDEQGSLLYVSSQTGAVVRDASARERAWNWLGAWLHWLYPLRDSPWWAQIVVYLALAATLMALLGQIIGLLRWRFAKPYRSGSRSPYAGGFARWHHLGGLLFGLLLIAWIFSGLMSMRPWQLFENRTALRLADYQGGELRAEHFPLATGEILRLLRRDGLPAAELEWRMLGGRGLVAAVDRAGNSRVLSMQAQAGPERELASARLLAAAQAMLPQGRLQAQRLSSYDAYYYARAEPSMYGHLRRPLPVLRVSFDDPAQTWAYLDPRSGAVLLVLDDGNRPGRWAFNLLHSWDWQPLLQRPRLREALVIVCSAGGLVISLTGLVLGWRRLRHGRSGRTTRASKAPAQTLQGEAP